MTEFAGSRGSNQTPGIAVLRGLFLGEQAVAVSTTVALDPVAQLEAQPMNGERKAGIGNAALVDQPAISDEARCGEPQSVQDTISDRLAWGAVWCMAAVAVAAFAMAVMQ